MGITYTYRGALKSDSRSRTEDTPSHGLSRSVRTERRIKGWEREEDPIIESPERIQGLQIMKTVQLSMQDESIELSERRGTRGV